MTPHTTEELNWERKFELKNFDFSAPNSSISTYIMLGNYIKQRLEKETHICARYNFMINENSVHAAMSRVNCELYERCVGSFAEIENGIDDSIIRSKSAIHNVLIDVMRELFDDCVRWSRIISMFYFCGELATHCARLDDSVENPLVYEILNWTCNFSHLTLDKWIAEHGGWEGLINHIEGKRVEHGASPSPQTTTNAYHQRLSSIPSCDTDELSSVSSSNQTLDSTVTNFTHRSQHIMGNQFLYGIGVGAFGALSLIALKSVISGK